MEILLILFVVIGLISSISKKKKEAEAQQKRAAQAAQMGQQPRQAQAQREDPRFPSARTVPQREDPRFPNIMEGYDPSGPVMEGYDPRFPNHDTGSLKMDESDRALRETQKHYAEQAERERQARERKRTQETALRTSPVSDTVTKNILTHSVRDRVQETRGRRHELEASSLSGHTHTENSMGSMAEEDCPSEANVKSASSRTAASTASNSGLAAALLGLRQNRDAMKEAIVLSEVLGKPKALRR